MWNRRARSTRTPWRPNAGRRAWPGAKGDWKTLGEAAQSYLDIRPSDREMAQLLGAGAQQFQAMARGRQRHGGASPSSAPTGPKRGCSSRRAQLRADMPHAARTVWRCDCAISRGSDALLACARLAVERGQMAEAAAHFARLAAEAPERALEELRGQREKGRFPRRRIGGPWRSAISSGDDVYGKMSKTIARDLLPRAVASERRGPRRGRPPRLRRAGADRPHRRRGREPVSSVPCNSCRTPPGSRSPRVTANAHSRRICRSSIASPATAGRSPHSASLRWGSRNGSRRPILWTAFLEIAPGDPKALVQRARAPGPRAGAEGGRLRPGIASCPSRWTTSRRSWRLPSCLPASSGPAARRSRTSALSRLADILLAVPRGLPRA